MKTITITDPYSGRTVELPENALPESYLLSEKKRRKLEMTIASLTADLGQLASKLNHWQLIGKDVLEALTAIMPDLDDETGDIVSLCVVT